MRQGSHFALIVSHWAGGISHYDRGVNRQKGIVLGLELYLQPKARVSI